jgi:hypothetical protein
MLLTDVAALIAFRRRCATAFRQQIDQKNLGETKTSLARGTELYDLL